MAIAKTTTRAPMMMIIIIINIISFMQGIYTYIPETNHVPREYSVSAILSLQFMVPISLVPALALLNFYVSTFRTVCAVPNMAVFCSYCYCYYYYYYYHHHYYYYYYYYYCCCCCCCCCRHYHLVVVMVHIISANT